MANSWRGTHATKYFAFPSFFICCRLVNGKNYNKNGTNVQEYSHYTCTIWHFNYHSSNLSKWIYRLQSGSGYGSVLFSFLSKYVVPKLSIHPGFRGNFKKETCDPGNNGTSYLAGRGQMGLGNKETVAQIEGK